MPRLLDLTAVPDAWSLKTLIDAWLHTAWLRICRSAKDYEAPLAVIEQRLEELWVSEPENAKQWLDAQEQKTSQHLPTSRQGQLSGALLRYARPELQEYAFVESFTPEGLSRTGWGSWTEGLFPQLQDECWRLGDRLVAAGAKAEEVSKLAPDPSAADGDRRAGEAG